ncbi:glycoside hydrolase family 43 protein [Gynuella sp.]|uniref:glycoside hydrolase family 43 protein n=1 Tax=Gynuella sp. TaxID=2969146 RepID=UPI003D0F9B4B
MTIQVTNPILPGFNPDPSICRVGDDYYIATSTFEWYPGVQISHSRDLKNWQIVSRPLNRPSQLNMLGNPDSCGVWAPCLSYADGQFWLIYTDVKRQNGSFKDAHNYLVTCNTIDGEWSDPIYLNSSGFDPSLFHEDDGSKWLVNMIWDYRPNHNRFGGILLQQYDPQEKKLIGPIRNIYGGTSLGLVEGPHLYKRNGYYYLFVAEGGTEYNHAETVARADNLFGPYETIPGDHLLTSRLHPEAELQRAGHASIVTTPEGHDILVHLCGRPIKNKKVCILGRETAIQNLVWKDDWPQLSHGSQVPLKVVDLPIEQELPFPSAPARINFDQPTLDIRWQWLRTPYPQNFISLTDRSGYLRLKGQESVGSVFNQSLLAIRQTDFHFQAQTQLEFNPTDFQQQAGLICYYNTHKYHYLYISYDETQGRHLGIMSCMAAMDWQSEFPESQMLKQIPIPQTGPLSLRATMENDTLLFSWSADEKHWHQIDVVLDSSILSDEAGLGAGSNFTGAFVGLSCQDLSGQKRHADFKYFEYLGFDQ